VNSRTVYLPAPSVYITWAWTWVLENEASWSKRRVQSIL